MFDAIGRHAIGELIEATETVTYDTVSKKTGNFNSLNFKLRDDYVQPTQDPNAILWDDDTEILWDDDSEIIFDG
jgi:hypothetical protein